MKVFSYSWCAAAVAVACAAFIGTAAAEQGAPAAATKPAAAAAAPESKAAADADRRLVRDGVVIEFEAKPVEGAELMEGKLAEVLFRITDERTGKPVPGARPGAWLDIGANIQGQAGADQMGCKEKIGLYLKGAVGIRPLADLNGYYLLVMNKDPSVVVIDPMVSMAGRTSTLASIQLKAPPMDWVNVSDAKRLFVTMPAIGSLAVIDTETLQVTGSVEAGKQPTRIVLQPDGKYLWVGNNAPDAKDSGVTVIDAATMKPAAFIATGRGHHEIAISADNRSAFVTNRDDGTVTLIDVGALKKTKDVKVGSTPLSVAYSNLSGAAYISDGKDGVIAVVDPRKQELVTKIKAKPGLGPIRFTPDGRFAMVVNTAEDVVNVIDPGSNEIVQSPKVGDQPFQVVFSRDFAYVRALGSERVNMINLSSLGKGRDAIVQSFAAGSYPPKAGGDLPLADAMTAALGEAAAFVVSPADNATYFYMEGMNAPMSSYPSRGKLARAVTVVDRSLKEAEPGVFKGRLRMPVAGRYDVAFSLDQPRMVHCFATEAKANPVLEQERKTVSVQYLPQERIFKVKDVPKVRFRLTDGEGKPKAGVKDVRVRSFLVPASAPRETTAKEVEPGTYEASVELQEAGAYYVFVGVPSLKVGFNDLPFLSLMAKPADAGAGAPAKAEPADKAPAKPKADEKQG